MAASASWRGVWFWYRRQIMDLLPLVLRQSANGPADALVVDSGQAIGAVTLWRRARGTETRLGTGKPADLAALLASQPPRLTLIIRLPHAMLLERDVVLPLAAEHDLAGALTLNFDTLTPFSAEEVFWTFKILRRQEQSDLVHIRLSLLPRAAIADVAAALRTAGRNAALVEFASSGEDSCVLPLSRDRSSAVHSRHATMNMFVGVAAGVLLAFVLQPTVALLLRDHDVEARIAALQPQLTQAEALRHDLDASAAGQDILGAERARMGDMLKMLALLTNALPDDTSLTELAISQRRLTLSGEATGAAKLVLALSANPDMADVAFSAPVTHAPSGGKDVFTLQAGVRQGTPKR